MNDFLEVPMRIGKSGKRLKPIESGYEFHVLLLSLPEAYSRIDDDRFTFNSAPFGHCDAAAQAARLLLQGRQPPAATVASWRAYRANALAPGPRLTSQPHRQYENQIAARKFVYDCGPGIQRRPRNQALVVSIEIGTLDTFG